MTKWDGFMLKSGLFFVFKDGIVRIGKCNPATKEVLEWYELTTLIGQTS